jgi:hypothetical protein
VAEQVLEREQLMGAMDELFDARDLYGLALSGVWWIDGLPERGWL